MIVLKFGGVALADSKNFANSLDYVKKVSARRPIVVVSAMKGITDLLLNTIDAALGKNYEATIKNIDEIKTKHEKIILDLIKTSEEKRKISKYIDTKCNELETLLYSVSTLQECTPKSKDYIVSFGERLSSVLFAAALRESGLESKQFDGEALISTDSNFTNAYPDFEKTKVNVVNKLGKFLDIPVIAGFIGSNEKGQTTTLGRGGTDFSASIIAYCLDADEMWYLKEVNGIMSADPKIVSNAKPIGKISYDEVAELSYFGAKVLHPIAIRPLKEKKIPTWVKNVYDFDFVGTSIVDELTNGSKRAKAVTSIKDICIVTVQGKGMVGIPGISGRVFSCLGKNGISVIMISQSSSEQNICFAIRDKEKKLAVKSLREELQIEMHKNQIEEISIKDDVSIISVVGSGLKNSPDLIAKIFGAMAEEDINPFMVALGSSELNMSFIVESEALERTIISTHRNVIGDEK